jgi:hypothetical protein
VTVPLSVRGVACYALDPITLKVSLGQSTSLGEREIGGDQRDGDTGLISGSDPDCSANVRTRVSFVVENGRPTMQKA